MRIETAMMESPENTMLPRGRPKKRKKRNIVLDINNSIMGMIKSSREKDEEEIKNGKSGS